MSLSDALEERFERPGALEVALGHAEASALVDWMRAWEALEAVPPTDWRAAEAAIVAVTEAYGAFARAVGVT